LQETEDMGVIIITHDLGVVAEIADRAVVLYKGKIVEQGPVGELFRAPRHPYTKGLLNCRPALHVKGERLPVVSDYLEGKEPAVPVEVMPVRVDKGEVLMKVEDLRVWYPAKRTFLGKVLTYNKAVDGVSFEVYKGETLGLVGESGCGKTTLGRAVLRLVEPTDGRIFFEGRSLGELSAAEMKGLRSRMQLIFQDPYSSLNPRLTIGEAIAEAMKVHGMGASDDERRQMVVELLEKVSLTAGHYDRWPHEFSGGQRRRRIGVGAGCECAGAGAEPAERSEKGIWVYGCLYLSRPFGHPVYQRSHPGDE
jgi:peptide/nickel transport system ATP-binding protein